MRFKRPLLIFLVLLIPSGAAAGCGGDVNSADSNDAYRPSYKPPADAKRGGELTVLAAGDVDSLDPGLLQGQFASMISKATQRTLVAPTPGPGPGIIPDVAALPTVKRQQGIIEFKLRHDVRFSPPVSRRVIADDFKYALERGLLPGIANGFLDAYFGNLKGLPSARRAVEADSRQVPDIIGIEAPSSDLLRLHFRGAVPLLATEAFALPAAAAVPREYAATFDREIPSAYGLHAVASGPYMVENDEQGNLTGYRPGVDIQMTRNPEWSRQSDFRPAFLDRIKVEGNYANTNAASKRILSGKSMVNGDFPPGPTMLKQAAEEFPDQLEMIPSGAIIYAALNTTIAPLDHPDVRRAVIAAADRNALRLARGGEFSGRLATHFIPPGVPGFEEAGGAAGPGFDFLNYPSGNAKLAASYMRKAGYSTGRYDGRAELSMVTDTTGPGRRVGEIVRQALSSLGMKIRTQAVSPDVMYTRFCNVPKAAVAVCPNVGWVRSLDDAQTVLDQTFSGSAIRPVNNSNWPQLNVPTVNRAILQATRTGASAARARAWGRADRLITSQAPAIPIVWAESPAISSANVRMVIDAANASPSLPRISLSGTDD